MKRKVLAVFLSVCMALTLVPAASAHQTEGLDAAKIKADYYDDTPTEPGEPREPFATRYYDNTGNDDASTGSEDRDHIWDPIAAVYEEDELSKCTSVSITISDNIVLEDTTILVKDGLSVTISTRNHDALPLTMTCKLSGTVPENDNHAGTAAMVVLGNSADQSYLGLENIKVNVVGPGAADNEGTIGNNPTTGIYNTSTLAVKNGGTLSIDGVSGNGVDGNGNLQISDDYYFSNEGHTPASVTVKNVGGYGIKAQSISTSTQYARQLSITAEDTGKDGIFVDELDLSYTKLTTKNTNVYGIVANDNITLYSGCDINAEYNEAAGIPAPIRLTEGGTFYVPFAGVMMESLVFLETGATVTGDGKDGIPTTTYAATIGDTLYDTLPQAVTAATEGNTISLYRDVALGETLNVDKTFTLSGGTYALSNAEGGPVLAVNGGKVTITDGFYSGALTVGEEGTLEIQGGYFTADPSAYVAEGKAAVESDRAGYNFMVTEAVTETPADVVAGTPEIGEVSSTITNEQDKNLANSVKEALTGSGEEGETATAPLKEETLAAAASTVANNNKVTTEQGAAALKEAGISTEGSDGEAKEVSIVIQPYMDIAVTGADSEAGTFTLDITPMYRTIATTANLSEGETIQLKGGEGTTANAAQIGDEKELPVTNTVTVTLPLPEGFAKGEDDAAPANLYVTHAKGDGSTYIYTGTVKDNTLTFTNPNGFSSFTVSKINTAQAQIGEVGYPSLQAAVDKVTDGGIIKLLKGDSATVSKEISFTVTAENGATPDITPGNGYEMSKQGNTFTFTKAPEEGVVTPPANPNYKITLPAVEGGAVTASPAAAKAGTTVTLTATPEEGYALASLAVTDRFGHAVKVTEQADGTYTFTMPSGQVEVAAAFAPVEEPAPEPLPFPDVAQGDWFYDAVAYVYETGLMLGVEDNQFAPNATTTRAQLATILHRLAGEPAVTGEAGFADVAAGTWYHDAVTWAAASGVVNGIGDNQFGPGNTLTREQLVTMLYRYAQGEGYDLSAAADLSGYPDAGQIQSWAQEAMSWAVGQGIVEGMDGTLNPAGSATRAQIATILLRFCQGGVQ